MKFIKKYDIPDLLTGRPFTIKNMNNDWRDKHIIKQVPINIKYGQKETKMIDEQEQASVESGVNGGVGNVFTPSPAMFKSHTVCKFKCTEVTKMANWNKNVSPFLYAAKFTAVTDNSPENKSFFEATPAGSLSISSIKFDLFEPGKFYYLHIYKSLVN